MGRTSRYLGNNFFLVTTADADKNKEKTRDGKTVLKGHVNPKNVHFLFK